MDLLTLFAKKQSPKDIAKGRLQMVLTHDRTNCSPEILEMLKNDIIQVIMKYMEVDENELDIQLSQAQSENKGNTVSVLYANVPIKSIRRTSPYL